MAISKLQLTVVVFDLDDTLYKEDTYHSSGISFVCDQLNILYDKDITDDLMKARKSGTDLWEYACTLLKLPFSVKESLAWMYRLHAPSISLDPDTRELLRTICAKSQATIILTDGRSISQRQKLHSLGLLHIPTYISEDWNSTKPDAHRFEKIMENYPADHYVYVGDNIVKDFISPNKLGWATIGLKDNGINIHPQNDTGLPSECAPTYWIESLSDLEQYFV